MEIKLKRNNDKLKKINVCFFFLFFLCIYLRSSVGAAVVGFRTRCTTLLLLLAIVVVRLEVSSAAVVRVGVSTVRAIAGRSVGAVGHLGESAIVGGGSWGATSASSLTHALLLHVKSVLDALLVRVGQAVGLGGTDEQEVHAAALLEHDEAVVGQTAAALLLVVVVDAHLDHLAIQAEEGLEFGVADLRAEISNEDLLVVRIAALLRILQVIDQAIAVAVESITVVEFTTAASVLVDDSGTILVDAWLLLLLILLLRWSV